MSSRNPSLRLTPLSVWFKLFGLWSNALIVNETKMQATKPPVAQISQDLVKSHLLPMIEYALCDGSLPLVVGTLRSCSGTGCRDDVVREAELCWRLLSALSTWVTSEPNKWRDKKTTMKRNLFVVLPGPRISQPLLHTFRPVVEFLSHAVRKAAVAKQTTINDCLASDITFF